MSLIREITINSQYARQTGRTTALVEAALKIGALFVCHSDDFARHLKGKYKGLNATGLGRDQTWFGMNRNIPVIFDHHVIEMESGSFGQRPEGIILGNPGKLYKNREAYDLYKEKQKNIYRINNLVQDLREIKKELKELNIGKARDVVDWNIETLNSEAYHLNENLKDS